MVDMKDLCELQITIFLLMIAGYSMTRLGIFPAKARKPITDLIIDFILPCNIIVSFMLEFNREILLSAIVIFMVSIGIQLFAAFAGRYFYPGTEKTQLAVLRYATIVSNAGFLGNPVVQGLYGTKGLLYASIYLIPQRIVMWSAGVSCFTGARGKNVLKKVITHPCIVAVCIGIIIMALQIRLPGSIVRTLNYASNCTTAMSMLVIGNILAEVNVKNIIDKKTVWFCIVRLLIFPAIVLVVCGLIGINQMVTEISVVLAGMPAAATTAILAAKYEGDEHFAVKLVFLSTLLSFITIPTLCTFMSFCL